MCHEKWVCAVKDKFVCRERRVCLFVVKGEYVWVPVRTCMKTLGPIGQ